MLKQRSLLRVAAAIALGIWAFHALPSEVPLSRSIGLGRLYAVAFSPDGSVIASSHETGSVALWDVETGETIQILRADGPPTVVWSVAWSPDGQNVAASYSDGRIIIWDVKAAAPLRTLFSPAVPQGAIVTWNNVLSVAWSPDGKALASSHLWVESFVVVWDLHTGERSRVLDARSAMRSPSDRTIPRLSYIAWDPSGTAVMVATADSEERVSYETEGPTEEIRTHVSWPLVFIWDTETGEIRRISEERDDLESPDGGVSFNAIAWSGDGWLLAWGSSDGTTVLASARETRTGRQWELTYLPSGMTEPVSVGGVAFSPDGNTLASAYSGGDGSILERDYIRLWDTSTGKEIATFPTRHEIESLAWSPDGGVLVSAGRDGLIKIWDTRAIP